MNQTSCYKPFSEFTEEEQRAIFEKNVETLYNNHFQEERDELINKEQEKLENFEDKWQLNGMGLKFEVDNYDRVTFISQETYWTLMDLKELTKNQVIPRTFEDPEPFIERYENLTNVPFEWDVVYYKDELEFTVQEDWEYTHYMTETEIEKRIAELKREGSASIKKKMKEFQLKSLFQVEDDDWKEEFLDEVLVEALKGLSEKTKWMNEISTLVSHELEQLKKEISEQIDYLQSDQFLIDQLKENETMIFEEETYELDYA